MKLKKKDILYITIIALLVIAIGVIAFFGEELFVNPPEPTPEPTPAPTPTPVTIVETVEVEVEKVIEVEKPITVEIMEEGLSAMGVMLTGEYYFTDITSYEDVKHIFKSDIKLPFSTTSFLISYSGVVNAGLDFTAVTVEKDDENNVIKVTLPKAEIQNVVIDHESFKLHSEKSGILNPLSAEDVNLSLVELEDSSEARAVELGLLDSADKNARLIVLNFINSLVGAGNYNVMIETAE